MSRILLRALFDPKTGVTYVRHVDRKDGEEWIDVALLKKVKKNMPLAAVSETQDVVVQECANAKVEESDAMRATMHDKGTRPMVKG